jgi:hypothetical protein
VSTCRCTPDEHAEAVRQLLGQNMPEEREAIEQAAQQVAFMIWLGTALREKLTWD